MFGGGDTGIDVGFGCLCTHFLGGEEVATGEFLGEYVGIGGGHIGNVPGGRAVFPRGPPFFFLGKHLAGGV